MLRVSAFMHGHGHPEPAKKLNDKIPKTVDEMFKRVRSFIRGEAAAGKDQGKKRSKGVLKEYGDMRPLLKKGHVQPLTKTPKEILAMKSVNFPPPPPLVGTLKTQNLNKFYDYHGDGGTIPMTATT
ncbi:hypothetical protein Tco_0137942 [Tanacetum coccineum]